MFNMASGPSLADIAAVTGNNNGSNGWGDGNGWWVLIILFALFGGWGRQGNNGNSDGGNCCCGNGGANVSAEIQRGFDTQGITNKLNGLENGICSLGYDQLAQMNGITQTVMQTGFGIQQAINSDTVANMQNTNAISRQLADCCCENRQAIAQVRYDMATDTCAVTNAIKDATQAIIANDNANYRQLHDEQVALQMENLKSRIAEQQSLINSLNLAQSQANQNNYLINTLRPCPVPAYITCNPYAYQSGCNNDNRCCNNF